MKKLVITGTLENWKLDPIYTIIWGRVYNDIHHRFDDGQWIHTSSISGFNENKHRFRKGSKIKTLNSVYLLGKKWKKQ